MAPFRKLNKVLTCFYCGRKSTTRYDGRMQHFECKNCLATNYLDSHGEITDPPVATTAIPTAPRYVRRSRSPSPSRNTNEVFCKKCLDNQHLFTASLAQYLPDDPNDPEYAERERDYWKFYRGLEKRYPQVCAECEPKVSERLDKAAFTAKTDHLRRMLRRTAENRDIFTPSAADYFHSLGRWLWNTSFWLHILWCILHVRETLYSDTNEASWAILAIRIFDMFTRRLPRPERIMYWSFWASLVSCWWNPRWVECCKGRTKNIFGFPKFYAYQALGLALRLPGLWNVSVKSALLAYGPTVQVMFYTLMALFTLYLYRISPRSIRVEHIPLWQSKPKSLGSPLSPPLPSERPKSREGGQQTMADILDEILNEPTTTKPAVDSAPEPQTPNLKASRSGRLDHLSQKTSYNPNTAFMSPNPFRNRPTQQPAVTSGFDLGGLSISDPPQLDTQQPTHYDVEMDWSPTQSHHRAFSSHQPGRSQNLKFGETPVQERPGVFWAKVPPAPITPARRLFNPPNPPVIRASPSSTTDTINFQGSNAGLVFRKPQSPTSASTEFAEPKLLLKPSRDERDSLADMFKRGFSLNPSPRENSPNSQLRRGQTFIQKFKYLVFGLSLAVLGNWAYSRYF